MKRLLVLLLIAPFFIQATNPLEGGEEKMPSIVIKNLEGQDVDLQKLTSNGKITIVSFWATWCSPCKKELSNMNELIGEWKEKYNVQIVAISIDDSRNAFKVKPYIEGVKWSFDVLIDVNQDTKRSLNYPNVPYTLLVDQNGNIVYKHTGYTEGDEYVLEDKIKALQ
jgi:cytochrome c biogenesis protein CcmG, thiol:disulfide interchange protein DsbE